MKATLIAALLLPIVFACNKQNFKASDNTEILTGPPPPTSCPEPAVTVSTYAGYGGIGYENGKLLVAGLGYVRAIAQSTTGAVQYVATGRTIRKISGIYVTDLITLPDAILSLATDQLGNIYAGGNYTLSKMEIPGAGGAILLDCRHCIECFRNPLIRCG